MVVEQGEGGGMLEGERLHRQVVWLMGDATLGQGGELLGHVDLSVDGGLLLAAEDRDRLLVRGVGVQQRLLLFR